MAPRTYETYLQNFSYPLPHGFAQCLTLGMKGYVINSEQLMADLKANISKDNNYYLIKVSVGFKTEDFTCNKQCDFDLGVKRAELTFTLTPFLSAEECFPEVEQAVIEEQKEHEVVASISPEGQIEFLGFKASLKVGGKQWRTLTKTSVTTTNTYCYCYGKFTSRPGWIFQHRKGQSCLESQREVVLVVEAANGRGLGGYIEFYPRDIVLLDHEHDELRWPKRLLAKIVKLISRDPYYSPGIAFSFGYEQPSSRLSQVRGRRYPTPIKLEGTMDPPRPLTKETITAIKQEIQLYRRMGQI